MATHELKSWPDFFEPLLAGVKTFELRVNDRNYQVGDVLRLREWDDRSKQYTGRELEKRVTYIITSIGQGGIAPLIGLNRHFCIMSLAEI